MTRRPVNPIRRAEALDDDRTERAFVWLVVAVSAGLWLTLAGAVIWGALPIYRTLAELTAAHPTTPPPSKEPS